MANFIGSDSRRFYIRVKDPSANKHPDQADTVTVDWYTLLKGGADDDNPNSALTLIETGTNTSVFVSKALMLVSDDVNRAQPTNNWPACPE